MKRIALVLSLVIVAAALAGAAVLKWRSDLVPAWIRRNLPAGGDSTPEHAGLFCAEHGVPEAYCTLCHPELEKTLLLCPEHGNIPEDICTLCHPEVEKKHGLQMCPKGHGLPAHFCMTCGKTTSAAINAPDDGWCATHARPEVLCADCAADPRPIGELAPGEVAKACRQPLPLVRLATTTLAGEIGLDKAKAELETHGHTVETNAEIAFDANAYADVVPRVEGILREIRADLGQAVAQGDVLVVVDSPQVSAAKSRLVSARAALKLERASYERTRALAQRDALPAKQELEALTALNQAESAALDAAQALRNLGLDDAALEHIVESKDLSSMLPVFSPIAGTVIQRHAVTGEAVQPTTAIFAVADTSRMWLWLDVYEADVGRVHPGQRVSFRVPASEAPAYEGRVTWTGAEIDPVTRTARMRAEVVNEGGRLRANQFGQAVIEVADPHQVVVIPKAAVQTYNDTAVVFLPVEPGVYRPQRILTQPSNRPDVVEVAWGLSQGDEVVTTGSFWLKTEIMKGEIGAGCCE
jgi:cobalt-zinc-cadmium efflux system membrane fusion protein